MTTNFLKRGIVLSFVVSASVSQALNLEQYLELVQEKNGTYKSQKELTGAAEIRYEQANLELSPVLAAGASYLDDKALNYNSSGVISHQQVRNYSLGLAKKFSTGTQASVSTSLQSVNSQGTSGGMPINNENHTGTMAFSLSQSLWKDFFGQATRMRWERESSQQKQELTLYTLQRKQSLIEAESLFWDYIYFQEERQIRRESLERAKKISNWVKSRVANGIGDEADDLNAKALVASRELQLIMTEDELMTVERKIADQLHLDRETPLPLLEARLLETRKLETFVEGSGNQIQRLDAYLSRLEAATKSVMAREAQDKVRPDLVLAGQYKTNGYQSTATETLNKVTDREHPVTGVSLTFTWLLDWDAKNAIRDTAHQEALAAQYKQDQLWREGQTSWSEISRRHQELSKKIQASILITQLQRQRADAEREKLARGRSITSQVITAEQEAAESALTLTKMKAEQRKLETQARLFVRIEEK